MENNQLPQPETPQSRLSNRLSLPQIILIAALAILLGVGLYKLLAGNNSPKYATGTTSNNSKSGTVVSSKPLLYLSPASQSPSEGSTITLEVHENSGTTAVNAVQANITYPKDKLKLTNQDYSASAFPVDAQKTDIGGKVLIGRGIIGSKTGDQLVGKLTFKVISASAPASLSFTTGTALVTASGNNNMVTSLQSTRGGTY